MVVFKRTSNAVNRHRFDDGIIIGTLGRKNRNIISINIHVFMHTTIKYNSDLKKIPIFTLCNSKSAQRVVSATI